MGHDVPSWALGAGCFFGQRSEGYTEFRNPILVGKVGSWKCFPLYFCDFPSAVFAPLLSASSHLSSILAESILARPPWRWTLGLHLCWSNPASPDVAVTVASGCSGPRGAWGLCEGSLCCWERFQGRRYLALYLVMWWTKH